METRKIIIDCDPGHDDVLAIMWALAIDSIEILGITTVAGNQTIEKVTYNTLSTLTLLDRLNIPVAKGASQPLVRELSIGGEVVHGDSGLEGPKIPEPRINIIEKHAIEFIIETLENSDEPITIVAVGPLTNIGYVLKLRPDLMNKIQEISIMGGGTFGNYTPAAEYNIWADAEAAKIVFNSGIPIIMAGLDATHQAYVTLEENEMLRQQGNKASVFAAELIDHFIKFHLNVENLPGCTLHDPVAVAYLAYPEIFETELVNVDVEIKGQLTYGMTLVDRTDYLRKVFNQNTEKNTRFISFVNRELFVEKFLQDMKVLG